MIDEEVPGDCGAAKLRYAELTALGYGKSHPSIVGLEAKLTTCPRDTEPPDHLCSEALLQRQDLEQSGAGPKHPAVLAANAMLAVCTKPIRVTRAQCFVFEKRLHNLRSDGLGERHPEILATEKRLAACEAARRLSPPVPGNAFLTLRAASGDFATLEEPLKMLMAVLGACAPIDLDQRFNKEVLELTLVMDRKQVTDARATGEKSSAETLACVSRVGKAAAMRGSPGSKLVLGVELTHGFYE